MTKFGDLPREQNHLVCGQMSGVKVIRGVNKLLINRLSLLPISGFAILRHTSSEEERKKSGRLFNSNRLFSISQTSLMTHAVRSQTWAHSVHWDQII